jgi:hypothetical protein
VEAGTEDAQNGQQVFCEFCGWTGTSRFVENHDLPTVLLHQPLDKLKAEPGKAVGNHNPELIAAQAAFQYGSTPLALEVETAGNVSDDGALRLFALAVGDLSLQVIRWLGKTDSGTEDGFLQAALPQESVHVKSALAGRCADRGDQPVVRVPPKSIGVQAG